MRLLNNTNFDFSENYPLYISLFNRGLSDSNGDVIIDIIHSDNLIFELDEFSLDQLKSREDERQKMYDMIKEESVTEGQNDKGMDKSSDLSDWEIKINEIES
mgnify:CR=1 FL=1